MLGRVPWEEMPRMLNPDAGFIGNANNRPVGAWYPHDLGIGSTGSGSRAWRVHQLIEGDRKFSVETLESDVHRDDMHAATSALLPVARKVAEEDGAADPPVLGILEATKDWDYRFPDERSRLPRRGGVGVNRRHGVSPQRPDPTLRLDRGGRLPPGTPPFRSIPEGPSNAKRPEDPKIPADMATGRRSATGPRRRGRPGHPLSSLPGRLTNGLPSVDPSLDAQSPRFEVVERGSVWSPKEDGYSQIVDLNDIDNSRAMIAPGISEDPESPFYLNQMDLWAKGELRPAPLSRERIEELAVSTERIAVGGFSGDDLLPENVADAKPDGARFYPAIPLVSGMER